MLKYKVRFLDTFKDGTIFGSKNYKVNEVDVIDESQYLRARNSGAILEVIETLVPNPLKNIVTVGEELSVSGSSDAQPDPHLGDTPAKVKAKKNGKS